MSSKINKKKLKMERLSPIPVMDRSHVLSDSLHTPARQAGPPLHRRQKDTYAIETTSSPEFGHLPVATSSSSLQKQRRYRNITRGKVPKKPNSTPLSGLICRKPVGVTPNEALHFSDPYSSPTSNDKSSPRAQALVSGPEELPQIDDYSPQKPTHSPRHSEIISASVIFPQKPQPSTSTATPLAGFVNKKASNLNLSLNDSMTVLREAQDPSDDEEIASDTRLKNLPKSVTEKVSIESFESPRKPCYVVPKEHTTSASIFKMFGPHPSKNPIRNNVNKSTSVTEKESTSSVEMCGNERKNRRRALDFNSTSFVVPFTYVDAGDGRKSPVLRSMPHGREPVNDLRSAIRNILPSSYDGKNDCQSAVINLTTPCHEPGEAVQSSGFNVVSPSRDCERDCRSPVLDFVPPSERVEDCQSPTLSLVPPSPNRGRDCGSPIISLLPPARDLGENHKSPVLNHMSPRCEPDRPQSPILSFMFPLDLMNGTSLEPLKSERLPEIKPFSEKLEEECSSDTDSVIESTPRRHKNQNPSSGGFTASSCLKIESDSPQKTSINTDDLEIPKIMGILEETSGNKSNHKWDLKFVVVSHDTSNDESINDSCVEHAAKNSCGGIFPTIDSRHSPVELNYTKRPIQSFESPSKANKPFSEAVNIGAFGSPDSNVSYGDHQDGEEKEDGTTDDVIEPSTTQEYFEESEQVRPTKRRKKGSLLERVRGVIAKVDASNALFDYEMKCGLRPTKGKFVSAPLVILKRSGETPSLFLVCKPLKYCRNSSHVEDISSFVIVHVNKLPSGVSDGSVVVLHFPINVTYFSDLHIPCALVGHQIVPHPTEQKIDISTVDASSIESINPFSVAYSKPLTSFKTFSSIQIRTLREAALCQNLVDESNLYLTVLHVTKLPMDENLQKISVLCCDEEFQCCWLEFSSQRDIKRALALETLHILSDGSQVQTRGFSVVGRVHLDRKSKNLVSYCSNNIANNEMIFSVYPKESNWVISSTDGIGPSEVGKTASSIGDILSKKTLGCRYLLEVHDIEKEPQITLKDYQGQNIHFVMGENSCLNLDHPFPFFLDGVYFYDGKLFSDEHTRVVLKT